MQVLSKILHSLRTYDNLQLCLQTPPISGGCFIYYLVQETLKSLSLKIGSGHSTFSRSSFFIVSFVISLYNFKNRSTCCLVLLDAYSTVVPVVMIKAQSLDCANINSRAA